MMELDDEQGLLQEDNVFKFSEKSVRLGFIRRVYAILSCQLLLTISVIATFLYVPGAKTYMKENGDWLWGTSMAGTIVMIIVLACCENVRRRWPTNIICLALFTLCESVFLGSVTSHYDTDAVIMAAGITAFITFGLTLFALQTKWDFTVIGGVLFVLLFAMMGFGIVCLFVRSNYATIAYSACGAVLFGFYLIFDTQMMLGGNHKYSLSPEEYIFAALNLYLDIVNLFLYILSIIQSSRN